jgi:hypothetical protein
MIIAILNTEDHLNIVLSVLVALAIGLLVGLSMPSSLLPSE